MHIGATGSLVLGGLGELLKDKGIVQEAGKHVGLLTQGSPYAKLAGMAFAKLSEKLPGIIDDIRAGGPANVGDARVFDRPMALAAKTGQTYLAAMDTNKDGNVTQEELAAGLTDTRAKIKALTDKATDAPLSPEEMSQLNHLHQMARFGQMVTSRYEAVAALDGAAGVSTNDLSQLAALDGKHDNVIGARDWRALNSLLV